jgi:hypothetical protein
MGARTHWERVELVLEIGYHIGFQPSHTHTQEQRKFCGGVCNLAADCCVCQGTELTKCLIRCSVPDCNAILPTFRKNISPPSSGLSFKIVIEIRLSVRLPPEVLWPLIALQKRQAYGAGPIPPKAKGYVTRNRAAPSTEWCVMWRHHFVDNQKLQRDDTLHDCWCLFRRIVASACLSALITCEALIGFSWYVDWLFCTRDVYYVFKVQFSAIYEFSIVTLRTYEMGAISKYNKESFSFW